jgi:hypothetical protein
MDTPFQSAAEAAAMIGGKQISSRELTKELLERIDAINPAVNAVVELRPEAALQEAAAADEAIGRRLHPFEPTRRRAGTSRAHRPRVSRGVSISSVDADRAIVCKVDAG